MAPQLQSQEVIGASTGGCRRRKEGFAGGQRSGIPETVLLPKTPGDPRKIQICSEMKEPEFLGDVFLFVFLFLKFQSSVGVELYFPSLG